MYYQKTFYMEKNGKRFGMKLSIVAENVKEIEQCILKMIKNDFDIDSIIEMACVIKQALIV